ncbi:MAG: class I SAM-dependent methyltransferase [Coprobacillaceae bacterium]
MNYIKDNKQAWEEAFNHRKDGWGEDVTKNILINPSYYIQAEIKEKLDTLELKNKKVAQFCCNNGRELLSIVKTYGTEGIGFDIAENLIEQAQNHAKELAVDCKFVTSDILEIPDKYTNQFDVVIFTIGAITWFENLDELFKIVSRCLKDDGILIIHDFHPYMNMLPLPGDKEYNTKEVIVLKDKYFSKEPWIENNGMGYISGDYESKTFISFSHSVSAILNSALINHIQITSFNEYDYDVGLTDVYDKMGLPLAFLFIEKKLTLRETNNKLGFIKKTALLCCLFFMLHLLVVLFSYIFNLTLHRLNFD